MVRKINTRNLSVSVMIHNMDNYKHKLLRKLFNNSIYSCESHFIIIRCSIILYVNLYREKSTPKEIQPRHRIRRLALLTLSQTHSD